MAELLPNFSFKVIFAAQCYISIHILHWIPSIFGFAWIWWAFVSPFGHPLPFFWRMRHGLRNKRGWLVSQPMVRCSTKICKVQYQSISWVWPLRSKSDHQDYYMLMFSRTGKGPQPPIIPMFVLFLRWTS